MGAKLIVYGKFTNENNTFDSKYKGMYNKVISYSVNKHATAVGEFTLAVDINADIVPDDILWLVDGPHKWWLVARQISYDDSNQTTTVTGTDLKGWLAYRNTLYAAVEQDTGTFGYDVVQGYTGACCAHYVRNNCIDPTDATRRMPRLVIDEKSLQVGKPTATYKARFELVSDVVQKLCENDGVCWDIVGDPEKNCFRFIVYTPTDRSAEQTVREQVLFSIKRKNVLSFRREIGNTELKNAFYATKSGGTLESDAYTAVVYRDEENIPTGYDRKEMQLNVSCEDFSDVEMYALYNVTDYVETDSFNIQTIPSGFNTDYFVGDRISVYDSVRGAIFSPYIKAATYNKSISEEQLSLVFGTSTPKIVQKLLNKIKNGVK